MFWKKAREMNGSKRWSGLVAVLALACLPATGPAMAQEGTAQEDGDDGSSAQEITVIAPRPITPDLPGDASAPKKEAIISLKMIVQYADLDLTRPEDADRLMVRVRSVARDACGYLDRLYPLDKDPGCEDRTVADTRPQVDQAIAATRR